MVNWTIFIYNEIVMKVVKKINNNVALALDGNGKELVAMGKGIGFPEMPYEVTDLSSITKTFYSIDDSLIGLFSEISEEIFDVSFSILSLILLTVTSTVRISP